MLRRWEPLHRVLNALCCETSMDGLLGPESNRTFVFFFFLFATVNSAAQPCYVAQRLGPYEHEFGIPPYSHLHRFENFCWYQGARLPSQRRRAGFRIGEQPSPFHYSV